MSAALHDSEWRAQVTVSRGEAFQRLRGQFAQAGLETPDLDARLLLCLAGGFSFEDFVRDPDLALGEEAFERVCSYGERRLEGEPVSRIAGRRSFWKQDFLLNADTLDPRPDTETLVAAAVKILAGRKAPVICDVGTGTGCILLSVLGELAGATGIGIDISEGALAMATENARRQGLAERARFERGSWLDGLAGPFDLVVSNPPYIPSHEIATLKREVSHFDPKRALDGGADGLDAYRAIIAGLGACLKADGMVLFEVGCGQADGVRALLAEQGFHTREEWREGLAERDLNGQIRIVAAGQRN